MLYRNISLTIYSQNRHWKNGSREISLEEMREQFQKHAANNLSLQYQNIAQCINYQTQQYSCPKIVQQKIAGRKIRILEYCCVHFIRCNMEYRLSSKSMNASNQPIPPTQSSQKVTQTTSGIKVTENSHRAKDIYNISQLQRSIYLRDSP